MKAINMTAITLLLFIVHLSAPAGASAESSKSVAISAPEAAFVVAFTPRHFAGWEARLAERSRESDAATPGVARPPTPSWYERKVGRGTGPASDSEAAPSTPTSRLHERFRESCTAALAFAQRPWCG